MQKYIFNLQSVKDNASAVTNFQNDKLIAQIKLLRKEMEGVKKDLQSLKYNLDRFSRDFDDKINSIKAEIDEQSNNKQILNLIDSEFNSSDSLETDESARRDYLDSSQFEKDQKEYNKALSYVNKKDFDLAILELKKFITSHPDNILNFNAYFYLGEIFYEKKNYTASAIYYLKGFQSDKNGARALSNITMLARCLSKIGNYDKACKVANYAEYKYSDRPIAIKRVLNNIKRIAKCKQTYEYG